MRRKPVHRQPMCCEPSVVTIYSESQPLQIPPTSLYRFSQRPPPTPESMDRLPSSRQLINDEGFWYGEYQKLQRDCLDRAYEDGGRRNMEFEERIEGKNATIMDLRMKIRDLEVMF